MPTKTVEKRVAEIELDLAKHKAILEKFPDAKVNAWGHFTSKGVNKLYSGFRFEHCANYALYVLPYYNFEFDFNGIPVAVEIGSSPRKNKLAYIDWNYKDNKRIMRFARLLVNIKTHEFKEDMLNSCITEIIKFIQDHPKLKMDKKYLSPRIQKLLLFT